MRWLCFYSAITLTFLMATVRFDSHLVAAELSPEHSRLVKEVNDAIVAAGKSYASGNYDASGEQKKQCRGWRLQSPKEARRHSPN